MNEIYARDSNNVQRDLIWPGLVSVILNTDSQISCMVASALDYTTQTDPDSDYLIYFMKLLREEEVEIGLSLTQVSAVSLAEKCTADYAFLQENIPEYALLSAYIGALDAEEALDALEEAGFDDIGVLLRDYDPTGEILDYTEDGTILLMTSNTGDSHTFSEDLREKSLETALAYSVVTEDFVDVIYPEDEEDEWQNVYEDFASFTDTYYKPYEDFDDLSLFEIGVRARLFCTTHWESEREGDVIYLHSNYNFGFFILRTHDETILYAKGATFVRLSKEAYLVKLQSDEVEICLEDSYQAQYDS